jgi:predicted O-methyltransferase YrrM
MFNDKDFFENFCKRKANDTFITQRDVDLNGDVWTLLPLIYSLCYSIQAFTMVEIGTADGSTTMPMLKHAMERFNQPGFVNSVDPSGCEDCHRLVKAVDGDKHWKHWQMRSNDFFEMNNDIIIDFALIDGDHAWPQVADDVRNCCKRLSPRGFVMVTDFVPGKIKYEEYCQEQTYNEQCAGGIYKGLNAMIEEFPELSNITLFDACNASVIIGRSFKKLV